MVLRYFKVCRGTERGEHVGRRGGCEKRFGPDGYLSRGDDGTTSCNFPPFTETAQTFLSLSLSFSLCFFLLLLSRPLAPHRSSRIYVLANPPLLPSFPCFSTPFVIYFSFASVSTPLSSRCRTLTRSIGRRVDSSDRLSFRNATVRQARANVRFANKYVHHGCSGRALASLSPFRSFFAPARTASVTLLSLAGSHSLLEPLSIRKLDEGCGSGNCV